VKDKRPQLSPSKITTYLACPAKYYWSYVNPRGRWYMRSRKTFSFGTTLHRVLERFHDGKDTGVETTFQAVAAVEENWLDAGYDSADEMAEAMGEGKILIEAYAEEMLRLPPTSTTLAVEKALRLSLADFDLVGRIDRLDEHQDGSLEIIDYKTGRETVTEDDVASDLAMGCYQLLVRQAYPGKRVFASILALRSRQKASFGFSDKEAEEFRFSLNEIGREIICRNWDEYEARPKLLCEDCDFLRLCSKSPGFRDR